MITELRGTAVEAQHQRLRALYPSPSLPLKSLYLTPSPSSSIFVYQCIAYFPSPSLTPQCTPLRACHGRGPTTREILFYPLPRSNSLGFTGGGDTRHTRGTRSRSAHTQFIGKRERRRYRAYIKQTHYQSLSLTLVPSLSVPGCFSISSKGILHASRMKIFERYLL